MEKRKIGIIGIWFKIKRLFCDHSYHFFGWESRGDGAFACYECEKCGKLVTIEKHNG